MGRFAIVIAVVVIFSNLVFGRKQVDGIDGKEMLAKQEAARFQKIALANAQQTENQADYDVRYYDIHLNIFPATEQIVGSVEVDADVVGDVLDRVEVNLLDNMVVDSVRVENQTATFTHANDLVTALLGRSYASGEKVKVCIYYHGSPIQSVGLGGFGFDTYAGQPMIWTLSQPFGARKWWPCKDIPADKADSVDIRVTVPANLVVASNGLLRSVTGSLDRKTYWWHEQYPIVTYLVSLAIHPYSTFSDSVEVIEGRNMPIDYYVFPDQVGQARTDYARTKDMIALLSDLFGPYPFHEEKYGHAQFLNGGGMEHQTITSLGSSCSEYLVVHELAHQWWGDMVTCRDFGHIWLNEGFAVYSEALWDEFQYGGEQYRDTMNRKRYFGPGTIFVNENEREASRIFDGGLSYHKGSWVLHMLRHVVGDTTFFDILRSYASDLRFSYGTATTEGFQQVCEEVSGRDLSDFFHQWIYEEYYPHYALHHTTQDSGGHFVTRVRVQQIQTNTVVFHMPVDLRFQFVGGDTTMVVDNRLADQTYRFVFDEQPVDVALDPEGWILKKVVQDFPEPSFDEGILLVNGVFWHSYGDELRSAYEDRAFWGDFTITFWDCFTPPFGEYPSSLPFPIGQGWISTDVLGRFSSVIWVGNDWNGDLDDWLDTPIFEYLNAGGNLLLMTRMGQKFFDAVLSSYLGIDWEESQYNTLNNCVSAYPGFASMELRGQQSYNAVFNTAFDQPETILLFQETESFSENRGLGAWRKPQNGGTYKADGGQFVFISGRPYRYDHDDLRDNVESILADFFHEGETGVAEDAEVPVSLGLFASYPNPFNSEVRVDLSLRQSGKLTLSIYNLLGQRVNVLHQGRLEGGRHLFTWAGDDRNGRQLPSGVYFCCVEGAELSKSIKILKIQ